MTPPAVREQEFAIEIDEKKGKWPFLKVLWGADEKGRLRLLVRADQNPAQIALGDGTGVGVVKLSRKKALALRDFLDRTLDTLPDE